MHLHACGVGHLERVRRVQRRVHVGAARRRSSGYEGCGDGADKRNDRGRGEQLRPRDICVPSHVTPWFENAAQVCSTLLRVKNYTPRRHGALSGRTAQEAALTHRKQARWGSKKSLSSWSEACSHERV